MKKQLKNFLANTGLLGPVKSIYRGYVNMRYPNTDTWKLEQLELTYSTEDGYSKSWFYPRYANGQIHEPVATGLFEKYIKPGMVVLDIGGHLGYFSCVAGRLSATGDVHVFEVDPKCIGLIQRNIELNELANVQVHNYAVSDKDETIKIPMMLAPSPGLVINSNDEQNFVEVAAVKLDDYLAKHNIKPDFIKIDVEGAEWNVLSGMKKTLELQDLVMLVEIHVDKLKEFFDVPYKDCIQLLLDNGFTLENIDHRLTESSFEQVDMNYPLSGNTMLLCKKGKYQEID